MSMPLWKIASIEQGKKLAELEEKLDILKSTQNLVNVSFTDEVLDLVKRLDLQASTLVDFRERLDKLDVMVDDANVSHGHILLRLEKLEAEA